MVLSSKPVYFFEEAMEIMVRTVNIEPFTKEQEFLATPALTKEELTNAFEECLKQVNLNMEYFKDRFPYSCTKGLKYPIIDNIEWTDGFWTGMLWLAYEYTNDKGEKKKGYFRYWAPGRVIEHDGKFYLYVTFVKPGDKMGTYVLVADRP